MTQDGFALMFLSVIVIATDGQYSPSYGAVYGVFVACVLLHAVLASTLQRIMVSLTRLCSIETRPLIVLSRGDYRLSSSQRTLS